MDRATNQKSHFEGKKNNHNHQRARQNPNDMQKKSANDPNNSSNSYHARGKSNNRLDHSDYSRHTSQNINQVFGLSNNNNNNNQNNNNNNYNNNNNNNNNQNNNNNNNNNNYNNNSNNFAKNNRHVKNYENSQAQDEYAKFHRFQETFNNLIPFIEGHNLQSPGVISLLTEVIEKHQYKMEPIVMEVISIEFGRKLTQVQNQEKLLRNSPTKPPASSDLAWHLAPQETTPEAVLNLKIRLAELESKVMSLETENRVLRAQQDEYEKKGAMFFGEVEIYWSEPITSSQIFEVTSKNSKFNPLLGTEEYQGICNLLSKQKLQKTLFLKKVYRVQNPDTWKYYNLYKRDLEATAKSINENYLFHGTSSGSIASIMSGGFDSRISKESGLFGTGLYFAQDFAKSLSYVRGNGDSVTLFHGVKDCQVMLLCRVLLGDSVTLLRPDRSLRKPPLKPNPQNGSFHSVVGIPVQNAPHEFIVYNNFQAYPECT